MAYQAKRVTGLTKEFELVNQDGSVAHRFAVKLDGDNMLRKISQKHMALIHAQIAVQKVQKDIALAKQEGSAIAAKESLEVVGRALVDLIEACFGKEDADTIIEFYENQYLEMCEEVIPFIVNVVIPAVRDLNANKRKGVLATYNRKQRRSLVKGM
ncbi:MAG: hypothetical protein R3Y58_08670 [Eubacteriales bacterium]